MNYYTYFMTCKIYKLLACINSVMNISKFNHYKLSTAVNKPYILLTYLWQTWCQQNLHITYICVTDFISQQLIHRSVTALLQVCNRVNRSVTDLSQTYFCVWVCSQQLKQQQLKELIQDCNTTIIVPYLADCNHF